MPNRIKQLLWVTLFFVTTALSAAPPEDALWDAISQGGHTILMRHALAPGNGDPDHFDVTDCSTQRNLSDEGRQQARRTGQQFRDHGISNLSIYSSQWCRCEQTARLLELGDVTESPALNSFYETPSEREEKTQAAIALVADHFDGHTGSESTLLLVTHQVNITALTGVFPRSGEMVVARYEDGELVVIGSIE